MSIAYPVVSPASVGRGGSADPPAYLFPADSFQIDSFQIDASSADFSPAAPLSSKAQPALHSPAANSPQPLQNPPSHASPSIQPSNSPAASDSAANSSAPDLQELRRLVRRLEGGSRAGSERLIGDRHIGDRHIDEQAVVSTGCAALDRLLPQGGLRRGTVVEWAGGGEGGGAGTLALAAARQACLAGGLLVVLDRDRLFYPPVLAAWGMALRNVVVVRPERLEDELWAADQALRCPAVAAVWGRFDDLTTRDQRRLQLAAEEGGTLGLFRRPARCVGQPTWADVQWSVRPLSEEQGGRETMGASGVSLRQLLVTLTRCRGAPGGESVRVVWDEWTGELREVRRAAAQQVASQKSLRKTYVDQQADCQPAVPSLAAPTLVRRA